jgi:hypothetical protein
MKMPCGKYKGQDIEGLPLDYLLWVAENWKEDTEQNKRICEEADKEWQWREKNNYHS